MMPRHGESGILTKLLLVRELYAFAQKCQWIQHSLIEGATLEDAKDALWEYVWSWKPQDRL